MTLTSQIIQMSIHLMALKTQRVKVTELLEECSDDMFTWSENKRMKANPEKDRLLVSKKKTSLTVISDNLTIDINSVKIESSLEQKTFWFYY